MHDLIPAKRERFYYVIIQFDGTSKFYDTHLNLMLTEVEFRVLRGSGYYSNLALTFDNHVEQ